MIQVDNHIFFADGKWRYEGSMECYIWKWEDGELWWSPTDDITKAHWLKWSSDSWSYEKAAFVQRVKNATMTLTMEAAMLRKNDD